MTSDLRTRLLEAKSHLSAAFEIVDEVAPLIDEPERGALIGTMGARWEIARLIRQLGNIAVMIGTGDT
jgi:hypothetical protein